MFLNTTQLYTQRESNFKVRFSGHLTGSSHPSSRVLKGHSISICNSKTMFLFPLKSRGSQSSFHKSRKVNTLFKPVWEKGLSENEESECRARADRFGHIVDQRYTRRGLDHRITAWRYAGVNPPTLLPEDELWEGDDTGDFGEVGVDAGLSI